MTKELLAFWESLGERTCLITSGGSHTYQELAVNLRLAPTQAPTAKLSWASLLTLIRAVINNQPFCFNPKHGQALLLKPGLWLQTTGTTGEPKWVHHSWENWLAQYRLKDGGSKALLQVMAYDHIGGLHSIFSALSRGMTIVLPASKDGATVKVDLMKHQIFLLPTTPAHLALLLQSGCFIDPLPHLKIISYGAEAMSPALKQSISDLQPHIRWRETYGSTETGILSLQSGAEPGYWQPSFPFKVVDGELYTCNLNGEWVATGDFVEELEEKRLRFLGRRSSRVKVGGVLVSPEETATWLRQQPGVWQAQIKVMSNPLLGQVLEAHVWSAVGTDLFELEKQLRKSFPARFSKEAQPVRYHFKQTVDLNSRLKLD